MLLAIDIGNTFIKTGLFENDLLIFHASFSEDNFKDEILNLALKHNIQSVVVSSVGKLMESDNKWLVDTFNCLILNIETKVPFTNLYATPHSLGVDRIALTVAAMKSFPHQNVLIIDAGTCVTYDFINKKGEYLGGAIAPGIQSRYKSLHDHTANLPLLHKETPENFIGNNTINSIHAGVVNGIAHEIDGTIAQYKEVYKTLTVVLTGGDAEFLAKQLKSSIFVRPFFLLEGLNAVFNFQ